MEAVTYKPPRLIDQYITKDFMINMTPIQAQALDAIVAWQNETLPGTPEHERAMIAGSMVITLIPFAPQQLQRIDEIINE